jgi:pseudouridine-5'-phosphate glycosidase
MSSGLPVDKRLNNTTDIARVMATKWTLGLEGAVLVTTPVPEQSAMDAAHIESIIEQAVVEAQQAQIKGKDLTPYLLRKIVEQSGGQSLEANTALVKHNAQVGAAIAKAYAALQPAKRCNALHEDF